MTNKDTKGYVPAHLDFTGIDTLIEVKREREALENEQADLSEYITSRIWQLEDDLQVVQEVPDIAEAMRENKQIDERLDALEKLKWSICKEYDDMDEENHWDVS